MRLIYTVWFFLSAAEGAKILAIMALASKSHHLWNSAITHELARRGHEITYFSPDSDDHPPQGIKQILAEGVYEKLYQEIDIESLVEKQSTLELLQETMEFTTISCRLLVESKGFDQILEITKTEKFDLILFDITANECLLPLAQLQKVAPFIGVTAYGGHNIVNYLTGNPDSLAVKADAYLMHSDDMTFLRKIENVMVYWYSMYLRFYQLLPKHAEIVQSKMPDVQRVHDALDRMSILLINTHLSFDVPTPSVPALINVGGLHTRPPRPLPKDIQKFLDEATNGAIMFSLGTNLRSSNIKKEKLDVIIEALKDMSPVRFLWKFETDLPSRPSNVMIKKWLPQADILAHKNVKVFITHAGLLSIQEAIYHGKPMIGIPFFIDQHINSHRFVKNGFGERVNFLTMDKKTLMTTMQTVLENSSYTEKAQQVSGIFRDQPETPLERAIFWIEYVIRQRGAPHLRAPTLHFSWYQKELIDVYLVLITCLAAVLFVFTFLIVWLFRQTLRSWKRKPKSD